MSDEAVLTGSLDLGTFAEHVHRSPEASLIVDDHGLILWSNESACRLFGHRPGDLDGRLIEDLMPKELRALHRSYMTRYADEPMAKAGTDRGASFPAERADGSRFEAEISLGPIEVAGRSTTFAVIRDITDRLREQDETARRIEEAESLARLERDRREAFLRFLGDIRLSVLSTEPLQTVLSLILNFAEKSLGATHSRIVLPDTGGKLRIQATGVHPVGSVGELLPEGSIESRAYAEAVRLVISEQAHRRGLGPASLHQLSDIGPMVVAPLHSRGSPLGVLVAGRPLGSGPFTDADLEVVDALSRESAVALELYAAAGERRRLLVVEDRERIGRELQDSVLQRLFVIGMSLQSGLGAPDQLVERCERAVNDIDEVIATVRDSIFRLGGGPRD
jgi:PAS domain S-box-containing protein